MGFSKGTPSDEAYSTFNSRGLFAYLVLEIRAYSRMLTMHLD